VQGFFLEGKEIISVCGSRSDPVGGRLGLGRGSQDVVIEIVSGGFWCCMLVDLLEHGAVVGWIICIT
jgi:hypothetical protein